MKYVEIAYRYEDRPTHAHADPADAAAARCRLEEGNRAFASLLAVDHLRESLKLAIVLGHSGCGALTSAVDVFLNPASYLSLARVHTLRGLLDRLLIVVHASAKRITALHGADVASRPGYRQALIETSIVGNAALSAHTLQAALDDVPGICAAYGVYLIDSREVWSPRAGSDACAGLGRTAAQRRSVRAARGPRDQVGAHRVDARQVVARGRAAPTRT